KSTLRSILRTSFWRHRDESGNRKPAPAIRYLPGKHLLAQNLRDTMAGQIQTAWMLGMNQRKLGTSLFRRYCETGARLQETATSLVPAMAARPRESPHP